MSDIGDTSFGVKKTKRLGSDYVILGALIVWAFVQLLPVYNSLVISFTTQVSYARNPFQMWPMSFTLESYIFVFNASALWRGYLVTLFVLVSGVALNMFLSLTMAFALSRKKFVGKNILLNMIIVTMYFSGGIIPLYMLVNNLGMINSLLSMVLPVGMNTFNMLIIRNYFLGIPDALEESAVIDGAGLFTVFSKILLPLSVPVLATIALFYSVDRWNEWYYGMLFIRDRALQPLQLVLRGIISSITVLSSSYASTVGLDVIPHFTAGVKMASVFIAMAPIAVVYPFVQKFFLKGIMIGAIKG